VNPNLFEPIPASLLRRDLRKVLRRIERGEGPFRITRRNGPDLVLMPVSDLERLLQAAQARLEVEDVPTA
jgi:prevent-host-death family protein